MKIKETTVSIVIDMLALQLKCATDHIVKLEDELKQAQLHLEARIDQNIRDCNDQFALEQRIAELEQTITKLSAIIDKQNISAKNDADVIAVLGEQMPAEPTKNYKSLPEGCKIPAGFKQLAIGDMITHDCLAWAQGLLEWQLVGKGAIGDKHHYIHWIMCRAIQDRPA
jgi:uncharacterized coiled-coil protein SlyX